MGKVNYDRPFMDHIGWKKDNIFTENACKVNHYGPLVKYDRPFIVYIGRENNMAIKVYHDRPKVNYDRPRSSTRVRYIMIDHWSIMIDCS